MSFRRSYTCSSHRIQPTSQLQPALLDPIVEICPRQYLSAPDRRLHRSSLQHVYPVSFVPIFLTMAAEKFFVLMAHFRKAWTPYKDLQARSIPAQSCKVSNSSLALDRNTMTLSSAPASRPRTRLFESGVAILPTESLSLRLVNSPCLSAVVQRTL